MLVYLNLIKDSLPYSRIVYVHNDVKVNLPRKICCKLIVNKYLLMKWSG